MRNTFAPRTEPAPATPSFRTNWPYPYWIAHRGAGKLAPENTLPALQLGATHGYRMFECDVKLSRDEVPFLLHDSTLQRTTNGRGRAGDQTWQALSQLDAGSWHSPAYKETRLPTLAAVARLCLALDCLLNIEIKPTPGTERRTGFVVSQQAARLWTGAAVPPLLTSFSTDALLGARDAAPQLPRGLLLHRLRHGWLETARALDCVAVVCHHAHWHKDGVDLARSAGLRALSYTVNSEQEARRLQAWGMDGLITDRVDRFAPDAPAAAA